jgi:CheY-like chemotaxis protein
MQPRKLLAIDDDEMVLRYLSRTLGERYTLLTSPDPHLGIAMARNELPDLVLCDIDMPEMDGGAVCAALAEDPLTAHIPLMYLTAIVSPSEVKELQGFVGGRPGVSKRAPLETLVAAIERLLAPPASA